MYQISDGRGVRTRPKGRLDFNNAIWVYGGCGETSATGRAGAGSTVKRAGFRPEEANQQRGPGNCWNLIGALAAAAGAVTAAPPQAAPRSRPLRVQMSLGCSRTPGFLAKLIMESGDGELLDEER